MERKADWNMKQTVSLKIVAQLKGMTDEQQKEFIGKLLEHMEEPFVVALDFAYGLAPELEPKSEQEQGTHE